MIEELFTLYHCEYVTKEKEIAWLNHVLKDQTAGRLENEYGNYMRNILYNCMN